MKFLKIITNTLISLSLFLLIIIVMFINSSKTLISRENISNFISDANILNMDVNVLFNQEESGITLKEKIVDLALKNNIPNEIVEDILESEQRNQLLGDFFNQTITYIIEGGDKPQISEDTIQDIKQVATHSLNEQINIMLEEEQLNLYIDDYCKNIIDIIPDRNVIIGEMHTDLLQELINFNVVYIYLIIMLLLILTSIISKKWYYFISILGINMFLSGILFVVFGSMEYVISNMVAEKLSGMIPFILPLITNVLTIWFKAGVLVSFTSIVLILIYLTINKTKMIK